MIEKIAVQKLEATNSSKIIGSFEVMHEEPVKDVSSSIFLEDNSSDF